MVLDETKIPINDDKYLPGSSFHNHTCDHKQQVISKTAIVKYDKNQWKIGVSFLLCQCELIMSYGVTEQAAHFFFFFFFFFRGRFVLGATAPLSVAYCKLDPQEETLQWRDNKRDGVSNHRRIDCLSNRLFRRRSKKTSTLRVTGLCEENSPVTAVNSPQKGE